MQKGSECAGAWRAREERVAEITGLGRVRGLCCVLIALAAKLHLNRFTLGHCLMAAITHRLQREDNYSSLIFKNKAKPPGWVLCLMQKWGGVPGLCSRQQCLGPGERFPEHVQCCPWPGTAAAPVPSLGSLTRRRLALFRTFILPFYNISFLACCWYWSCPLAISSQSVQQKDGGGFLHQHLVFSKIAEDYFSGNYNISQQV